MLKLWKSNQLRLLRLYQIRPFAFQARPRTPTNTKDKIKSTEKKDEDQILGWLKGLLGGPKQKKDKKNNKDDDSDGRSGGLLMPIPPLFTPSHMKPANFQL